MWLAAVAPGLSARFEMQKRAPVDNEEQRMNGARVRELYREREGGKLQGDQTASVIPAGL